jgi:hypothetical protein
MANQNEDSWDNRELGASEEHVVAVSLDLDIDEALTQSSASPVAGEQAGSAADKA